MKPENEQRLLRSPHTADRLRDIFGTTSYIARRAFQDVGQVRNAPRAKLRRVGEPDTRDARATSKSTGVDAAAALPDVLHL
jgi:hypothetical protein